MALSKTFRSFQETSSPLASALSTDRQSRPCFGDDLLNGSTSNHSRTTSQPPFSLTERYQGSSRSKYFPRIRLWISGQFGIFLPMGESEAEMERLKYAATRAARITVTGTRLRWRALLLRAARDYQTIRAT